MKHDITRRSFLQQTAVAAALLPAGAFAAAAVQAKPWRIGCFTRPWDKFEYRTALDAIAEAGFKDVGLMTTKSENSLIISVKSTVEEATKVGEECAKRGLKVPSLYGGDIPIATSLQAGIDGLKHLIDCAAAAKVENLMMGGVGDAALHDPYYKAIAECCPYAAEKSLGLSVKPHGGSNSTGPQCRKILETVGQKNFGLWYDPGNIFYYSKGALNPVDDAATVDGLVVGMSVKDFKLPQEVLLTPGTGQVDFPKVLARLKQGGFTGGPLLIECLTPGELPQLLAEAKKAKQFVEQLIAV
jgi:sugar phosphate isomerase/epimerase